ncbi:MAG: type II toxin-antitoxin system RelB/DinJ family antitoxin [Spirochaetaceae bacterium]|nr:type II toxin-antitoxin system RelB/DinJ family antitoxin [Spirochaetaceae bacterium]
MAVSNITIRIDSELKKQGEELFDELGLSMTAAITSFIKQSVREQGIPFRLTRKKRLPNLQTLQAFEEIEEMKKNPDSYKSYSNAEDMIADIFHEI